MCQCTSRCVKNRNKTGVIVKFEIKIKITFYPLTPSLNKLHILMHTIVLHNFIYLFPWLNLLCELCHIKMTKTYDFGHIHACVFWVHYFLMGGLPKYV